MHSNDPAMVGASKHERNDNDLYETPPWCTEAALSVLPRLRGKIWEPSCGNGKISKVLLAAKYCVVSTDIEHYGFGWGGMDFFEQKEMLDGTRHIFTNPPFGALAEPYMRHALSLTKPVKGTVTLFLRNEFDCGKRRHDLFSKPPFKTKIVLTKRPMWIEGTKGSPRHNYAWFHFDWKHKDSPATIEYHLYKEQKQ